MAGGGVTADDVAEGLFLQLGEHIEPSGTGEVVEPVVVLEMEHLGSEHIGKGGTEHAAKGLELFC